MKLGHDGVVSTRTERRRSAATCKAADLITLWLAGQRGPCRTGSTSSVIPPLPALKIIKLLVFYCVVLRDKHKTQRQSTHGLY